MYYRASLTIDPKLLFGSKKCPRCGKKMKKIVNKVPFDNIEKKFLEKEPIGVHGILPGTLLNGEMKGHKGEVCLKCNSCGLVLYSENYKKIKKYQKKTNKRILTEEELLCAFLDKE